MSTGPVVALLDTVTFPELMTFLVVALVVLGPDKLPGMARSAGQWVQKLRKMAENLQGEVTGALDESEMQSLRELGEFAVRPRAKLVEYARKAATETDPDDHTDGDAPASAAPTLPPLGVGPDNPMVTNAPVTTTDATSPAPVEDVGPDVTPTQSSAPSPAPSLAPSSAPVKSATSGLPAHLAGTRLATGGAVGDPTPEVATDAPSMSDTSADPSTDDT
jgi:sec-independent protein translocase protein TatB